MNNTYQSTVKIVVALLLLLGNKSDAFTSTTVTSISHNTKLSKYSPSSSSSSSSKTTTTTLYDVAWVPTDDGSGVSYSERSRPYRRDVFAYDDWVRHRSTERFTGRLSKLGKSGIVRALSYEVQLLAAVATFICVFNALCVTGYDDFSNIHHDPLINVGLPVLSLPAMFFTLSSPALSLLLGTFDRRKQTAFHRNATSSRRSLLYQQMTHTVFSFRCTIMNHKTVFKTNTSYQRWDEARKNWGAIVNNSRTIMRQGAAWNHESPLPPEEKQRLMARLAAAVWCFPRSLTRHLLSADEDADDYAVDVRANLRPDLAEDLITARHKPTRAMYELSCAINEFPLSDWRRVAMDSAATTLCDAMGSSERIFTSPVPRFYTRHTARFLEVWLLLMPLTLYKTFDYTWNHWFMIPATMIISFFLLGIEELGIQLEEPFR
jgi:ion channel-forming bestrophin family protein